MLAFLSLFLKFYLADTPHRRNARSILEVGSEQLPLFYLFRSGFIFLMPAFLPAGRTSPAMQGIPPPAPR